MKKKTLLHSLAAFLLIALCAIFAWRYINAPYQADKPVWIYLPRGTSRAALADSLNSSLGSHIGIRVAKIINAATPDTVPIYGAYKILPGDKTKNIARRLIRHRQTPVRLTFNNIRTIPQLASRISRQMEFSDSDFLAALDSVLPAAGFSSPGQYPAAFLPDTYEFYWTTPAVETVDRLLAERNKFWTADRLDKARALGLSPVQVATLASIAEEETNSSGERATVGRLYLNRINRGMKLQADPTVKFAIGDFSLRRIRGKHLKIQSPYNTYLNPGLPPGPIRIASARTLDDILNAPPHPYVYMCAKEDFSGTHNFATDYAAHMANARRYQQALNRRNIK